VRIVEDGPPTDAASSQRPWWFGAALVGIALGGVVGAALLPSPPDTTSRMRPQEQEVIDRLKAIGVPAVAIGDSQLNDVLGSAFPSRDYLLGEYGEVSVTFPAFVGAPHDVRVCPTPNDTGAQGRVVYVDGQIARSVNLEPWVYLVSSQYFVVAADERAVSVLQRGLGVIRAPC
jgi:hypothetical protein